MARRSRIHVPGGLYHVILRGNGGQDVFFGDEHRYRLYLLMQEGVGGFGHRIHSFCVMTNLLHVAIQRGDLPSPKIAEAGSGFPDLLSVIP